MSKKQYNYTADIDLSKKLPGQGLTVGQLIRQLQSYDANALIYYEQIPAKSFVEGARVTKNMVIKDDTLFPGEKQYYVRATDIVEYNDGDTNLYITAL